MGHVSGNLNIFARGTKLTHSKMLLYLGHGLAAGGGLRSREDTPRRKTLQKRAVKQIIGTKSPRPTAAAQDTSPPPKSKRICMLHQRSENVRLHDTTNTSGLATLSSRHEQRKKKRRKKKLNNVQTKCRRRRLPSANFPRSIKMFQNFAHPFDTGRWKLMAFNGPFVPGVQNLTPKCSKKKMQ